MKGEIHAALIKLKGIWVEVHIDPDHDSRPQDADCYSPEDILAWQRDEWRYVTVTVTLRDHPGIDDSLSGVEWGSAPGFEADMSKIIIEHPVPDMLRELKARIPGEILALAGTLTRWEE